MSWWQRIEGLCRSGGLTDGLAAHIADPLWFMARQWQLGELRGDDAARPIGVRTSTRTLPLEAIRDRVGIHAMSTNVPVEYLVEQVGQPSAGDAGQHASARLGYQLIRLLVASGQGAARAPLLTRFGTAPTPNSVVHNGHAAATAALLGRRCLDGRRVHDATDGEIEAALLTQLDSRAAATAMTVVSSWRRWCASSGVTTTVDAWNPERLEYSFNISSTITGVSEPELDLVADEHTGGVLDWFSFDRAGKPSEGVLPKGAPTGKPPTAVKSSAVARTSTCLPSPVRYRGQPSSRWWEFEDGSTNFADVDAGPADLARLLVTEFAVAYSNDWFVVPVRVPVGSATEVTNLTVVDNFGGATDVDSVALHDVGAGKVPKARVWKMFELDGDVIDTNHRAPWLVVPTTAVGDVAGAALERVTLVRDEGANLVWGVERLIEGPAGRPIDRALLPPRSDTAPGDDEDTSPSKAAATPISYDDQVWRYRLESAIPPAYWIPFVSERIGQSAETVLRRARMQQWRTDNVGSAGPVGTVLDASRPCWVREEEVPASGIRVDRRWRYARDHLGAGYLWLQLEKSPAAGERSSGVRWDVIEVGT